MVHCLRQKTEEELLEVSLKLNPFTEDLDGDPREENPSLSTVVDEVVLPRTPEEILAEKNFNIVPYVVGINKQEFGWIIPMMMEDPFSKGKMDQKMPRSLLWKFHSLLNISENMIPVATEKYLGGTDDPVKHKNLLLDLFGDVMLGDHVRGLRDFREIVSYMTLEDSPVKLIININNRSPCPPSLKTENCSAIQAFDPNGLEVVLNV